MISPTTYPGQPGLWIDKWNKFTNVSTVTSCFCSLIHHRKQAQCGNSQQRPHSQAVIPTVRSPEINQPYPKLVRVLQVKKKNDSNQHLLYPNTELLFTWHHEGMQGISTPRIYLGLTPQLPKGRGFQPISTCAPKFMSLLWPMWAPWSDRTIIHLTTLDLWRLPWKAEHTQMNWPNPSL